MPKSCNSSSLGNERSLCGSSRSSAICQRSINNGPETSNNVSRWPHQNPLSCTTGTLLCTIFICAINLFLHYLVSYKMSVILVSMGHRDKFGFFQGGFIKNGIDTLTELVMSCVGFGWCIIYGSFSDRTIKFIGLLWCIIETAAVSAEQLKHF